MAFNTVTQSFGPAYALGTVTITNQATGAPATVLATTTGGVINTLGQASLDASGNLSVIIDSAITWNYAPVAANGDDLHAVVPLTYAEIAEIRTGKLGPINAQTGTTYTLALGDIGGEVQMSNASANTLTVPTTAAQLAATPFKAFPIPTVIDVIMMGAGTTTVAGAGITFVKPTALTLAIAGQYQGIRLTKIATDTWRANAI